MNNVFPDRDAVPQQNPNYPMAALKSSAYAAPLMYNRPSEALGGYDAQVNPMTGEEMGQTNFARGGLASLTQPSDDFTRAMHAGIAAYAQGGPVQHFKAGDKVGGEGSASGQGISIEGTPGFGSASGVDLSNVGQGPMYVGVPDHFNTPAGGYTSFDNMATGSLLGQGGFAPTTVIYGRDYVASHPELTQTPDERAASVVSAFLKANPGVGVKMDPSAAAKLGAYETTTPGVYSLNPKDWDYGTTGVPTSGDWSNVTGWAGADGVDISPGAGFSNIDDAMSTLVNTDFSSFHPKVNLDNTFTGKISSALSGLDLGKVAGAIGTGLTGNQLIGAGAQALTNAITGGGKGADTSKAGDMVKTPVNIVSGGSTPVGTGYTGNSAIDTLIKAGGTGGIGSLVSGGENIAVDSAGQPVTTVTSSKNTGQQTGQDTAGVVKRPGDVGSVLVSGQTTGGDQTTVDSTAGVVNKDIPGTTVSTGRPTGGDKIDITDTAGVVNKDIPGTTVSTGRPTGGDQTTVDSTAGVVPKPVTTTTTGAGTGTNIVENIYPIEKVPGSKTVITNTDQPADVGVPKEGAGTGAWTGIPLAGAFRSPFDPMYSASTSAQYGGSDAQNLQDYMANLNQSLRPGPITPYTFQTAPARTATPQGIASVQSAPPQGQSQGQGQTTAKPMGTLASLLASYQTPQTTAQPQGIASAAPTQFQPQTVAPTVQPQGVASIAPPTKENIVDPMMPTDYAYWEDLARKDNTPIYANPVYDTNSQGFAPGEEFGFANMTPEQQGLFAEKQRAMREELAGRGGWEPPTRGIMMPDEMPSMGDGSYPDMPITDESYYGGRKQFGNEPNIDEAFAHGGSIHGGLGSLAGTYKAGGKLLRGPGDGMSDSIPAVIHGKKTQRAALADGEFVIPADVVSHLGNGSTDAGARKLYAMMDKIRQARTGRTRQAPEVSADRYMPKA